STGSSPVSPASGAVMETFSGPPAGAATSSTTGWTATKDSSAGDESRSRFIGTICGAGVAASGCSAAPTPTGFAGEKSSRSAVETFVGAAPSSTTEPSACVVTMVTTGSTTSPVTVPTAG